MTTATEIALLSIAYTLIALTLVVLGIQDAKNGLQTERVKIKLGSRAARPQASCFILVGLERPVNLQAKSFSGGLPKRHQNGNEPLSACAFAHALTALAVGGKLTKRVHGSLECRGGWPMYGMGRYVDLGKCGAAPQGHRWRMTRPQMGLGEAMPLLSIGGERGGFDPMRKDQ